MSLSSPRYLCTDRSKVWAIARLLMIFTILVPTEKCWLAAEEKPTGTGTATATPGTPKSEAKPDSAEQPAQKESEKSKSEVKQPTPAEIAAERDAAEKSLLQSFHSVDKDEDGQLSETEFLDSVGEANRPKAKQELATFDQDGDGKLSLLEFRTIPSRVPPTLRVALPSPFSKLVAKLLEPINAGWKKWDSDQNGTLSEAEFNASGLSGSIPGLEASTWKDWDRDGDGSLSQADCQWLLEAGYGIRRLNGQLLHLPAGHVVYWWHFKELDVNRDEKLTAAEFELEHPDPQNRAARFKHDDADGNGEVSFKEWAESSNHRLDLVAEFLSIDQNLDGRIDPTEFQKGNLPWLNPLPKSVFPGFDLDQDGVLSLEEYRSTLVMNRVENWLLRQRDLDHDGRLNLSEFAWLPGLELALLKRECFRRLDVDHNGLLQAKEFSFVIDPAELPPERQVEIAFDALDINADGHLNESEYVSTASEADQPKVEQELAVFDLDHDEKLSFAEYRTIPARTPPEARVALPNPFAKLIAQHMATISGGWLKWDSDNNGTLSEAEFQASKLVTSIPGLETSTLKDWDRDADGTVSSADCQWLVEAGYGIRRLNGQLLYFPSGQIVYWWHFKELDVNRDDRLTAAEFALESSDKKTREARFQQDDVDKDGEISFKEWAESPNHWVDPLAEFLNIDKNLDGRVDQQELQTRAAPWMQRLFPSVFPGFDVDRDGSLTLDEFRVTLITNRVENWFVYPVDLNHDGRLETKEFTWFPGPELALSNLECFRRLDVDHNGHLSLIEFPFVVDMAKVPPVVHLEVAFGNLDTDRDRKLNQAEYVDIVAEADRPRVKQEFLVFDRDGDGQLAFEEYRTIPARTSPEVRTALPSPFAKLIAQHMATVSEGWSKWDSDNNGTLSEAEFQASKLASRIPGLETSTWKDWDRDADGSLSQADCQWLLEVGYGIRRMDGQTLYFPSGQVVYWWHFKELDVNRDDRLTAEEFVLEGPDPKGREIRFQRDDTNKDGEISFKEWAESSGRRVDPVAEFLSFDKNLDGRVSPDELKAGTPPWLHRLLLPVFPGFDLDRDGTLTLDEYRGTLAANRVENWFVTPVDVNHNGRLESAEFKWVPGLELALLHLENFRRLDRDDNGFLRLNEYPFVIDATKIPPEGQLEITFGTIDVDADGELNELEFVGPVAEADRPRVKQQFAIFDGDRNDKLSFAEFRSNPFRAPPELRVVLPGQFAKLVATHLVPISAGWSKWDTDKNGTLSDTEFEASGLARSIPGFEQSTWKDWDRDGDGSISQADCQWLLEVGYGIRRMDGQLLYFPSGQIVYWWHFKELDVNRDDRLTAAEHVLESSDKKGSEARFQRDDTDKNGEISFKEWAESLGRRIDPLGEFLSIDKNLDGRLDPAELKSGTANWLQRLTPSVFPGFDLDQDGLLTLDEYRGTLAVNRIENWYISPVDVNHNGLLEPAEFTWAPGVELALLNREYFRRLDVDHNGLLRLNEFPFKIDTSKIPPEAQLEMTFGALDVDADGELNESEFVGPVAEADRPRVKQQLAIFDRDTNGKLSLAEFLTNPARVPPQLRGAMPSPFAKLVADHLVPISANWPKWDGDKNGTLSKTEFDASGLAGSIPGFEQSTWKDWDRDGDGNLSQADGQWLLEVGYGIRRMDGQLLHLPSGYIVYWWHFKELDTNGDEKLTAAEFELESPETTGRAARFKQDDANGDGEVTFKEWAESSNHKVDPLSEFVTVDKNLDGRIDPMELTSGTAKWLQRLTPSVLPGFDLNQDGVLTLGEYSASVLVNRVENWLTNQTDKDYDGQLGLAEFAWLPGLELALLKAEYFRRYDIDHSGYLTLNEFPFVIDAAKVPPAVLLDVTYGTIDTDRDGKLTEQEFVAATLEPDRPRAKQELVAFDLDRDGKLTREEFRTIPSRVPLEARGALPSPFAYLVSQNLAKIRDAWPKWDSDKNGSLSEAEFKDSELARSVPGFEQSTWQDWDRDGDGSISQADCQWLLEAGYGIRRMNGQLLHLPTGHVVYWWHFKELDANRDEKLSAAEFELENPNPESRAARLKIDDADGDGEVSFKEWAESRNHRLDLVSDFLNIDKNLNGHLDPAEFQAGNLPWLDPLPKFVFPGFDLNQDGVLSLEEFRGTLVMNRVENWLLRQTDADNDGRLAPAEFAWIPGLELSLLKAEYFKRLDVDRNSYLQLNEFNFTIDHNKVSFEVTYRLLDVDGDGQLSRSEFENSVTEAGRPLANQEFAIFDQNQDGKLSLTEYKRIPSRVPTSQGGALTSPFEGLVVKHLAQIGSKWSKWDSNKNGTLSEAEFQASGLARSIPGFALSNWKDWDRDADGSLSRADCRWLLEAGYGMRRLNGQLLHQPTGHVVYWWHFKELDVDHNDILTRAEFALESSDKKATGIRFQQDDTDQDGEVTFKEWAESRNHRIDPLAEFLHLDKNLDGRVDPTELTTGTPPWLQRLTTSVFPGFDLDRDGKLNLEEFWATLLVNRVEIWLTHQRDRDNDGRLGPAEFSWSQGPELTLLNVEYFRRFDADNNGYLQLNEFPFLIDATRVPADVVFQQHDRNRDGLLNLEEVLGDLKPSSETAPDPSYEIRVARVEEEFQKADLDRDEYLNPAEFNSPQGKLVMNPDMSFKTGNVSSLQGGPVTDSSRNILIPIIIFNVLLVGGVIAYMVIKR